MAQNHTQARLQSALFVRARIDTKTTLFEDRMPRGVENCPAKSRWRLGVTSIATVAMSGAGFGVGMSRARHGTVLEFLGATQTVTGSRFLLSTPRARVLVDCGLYQGDKELRERNWKPLPADSN